MKSGKLPGVVNDFNLFVSMLDPSGTLYQPITPEEATPAKDDGTFEQHWWWRSERSKQVLMALKWLNHGNRDLPDDKRFFTLEERMSNDWRAHFIDTMKLIEGWREDEEDSPEDWFGMVSESYELLARKAPPGTDRDGAIDRFLNFMETHYASVESHNFWFTQLHGMWGSKETSVVHRFEESKNPVISLYAKVSALSR